MSPIGAGKDHSTERGEWDRHWADYGEPVGGNPANLYRTRLILSRLGHRGRGDTILDIGCGQGELALVLQSTFVDARVIGIEYSTEGVRRATEAAEAAHLPVEFMVRDLLEPASLDPDVAGKATVAICTEVLEHLDQPERLLRNASKYMATGCLLVVTVPAGPRSAFDRHIGHRRHFQPGRLRRVLESCDLEVEQVVRAGFPFFNLYRLAVIARGRRLIADLDSQSAGGDGHVARKVLSLFDRVFRWNVDSSPFGWQLVAVARFRGPS